MDAEEGGTVPRRRWWHRGPFVHREVRVSVGTVLGFLFLFYVVLPLVASHRSEVTALTHIEVPYLVLGVLLEIAALVAYTQLTHAVLPPDGPRRTRLFRINLSTLSLSHVSPGGTAPGAALAYRLLTQSGVSSSDTSFALGTQGIGSAVVLNVIFWFALVAFLLVHGFHAPTRHTGAGDSSATVLVVVAAAVGVVLLAVFGSLFYLLTRGQQRVARLIHRVSTRLRFLDADRTTAFLQALAARFAVLLDNRRTTWRAIGWAAANWILDAGSLWVFVAAFSHWISPVDLFTAYGLAYILAAIPVTPGGLGVVEFVLVSMITGFGPTAGQALSAVLAYRAVNFWLPIPFGGLAYASLEFQRRGPGQRLRAWWERRRAAVGTGAGPSDTTASGTTASRTTVADTDQGQAPIMSGGPGAPAVTSDERTATTGGEVAARRDEVDEPVAGGGPPCGGRHPAIS